MSRIRQKLTATFLPALLFSLALAVSPASPAGGTSGDARIVELMAQLGSNADRNAKALKELQNLIAQREAQPRARGKSGLNSNRWSGTVSVISVDGLDAQGNIAEGGIDVFLETGTERLELYFLDTGTRPEHGRRLTVEGYRSGGRVLVKSIK
ncbi:MAG TPA: hypothetical protein VGA00_14460 [Acidiferrobacterales bacterium]|jgi:hypothetical protein